MKEYIKPEVEFISLQAQEDITAGDDLVDGDLDVESSFFN